MKSKLVLSFLLSLFLISASAQQVEKYARVKVKCHNINELTTNGIQFLNGTFHKSGYFEGEINSLDISKLISSGFEYSVLIDDVTTFYTQRNKVNSTPNPKNIVYNCKQPKDYPVPAHFSLGSMGGFYTYDQTLQALDSMHILFPNLITQKFQIGTSVEGRPIYALKISDNPNTNENEKQVIYTAVHHAMEIGGLQQLVFYMYYLLENYNTDSEIKYLVDNLEIYFVPVVNPDGYVYNQTQNPTGGGTWRKNRRDNGLTTGVDLNRNYGYAFGYDELGSSSLGAHPWYRGTAAFSEPESQAMKAFIEAHNFLIDVNWHSYGNYLIYPWNYKTLLTQDSLLFEEFSRYISLESHYRYGTCDQTYGYNSNGDADDWGYGEIGTKNKIISITAEIGSSDDGFWPQTSNITPLCKKSVDMNLRVARLAAKYAQVTDISSTFLGSLQGTIPLETYCLGLDIPADFTVSLSPISSQISSTGNPIQFNAMTTLEHRTGAINYTLTPGTPEGTNLKFALSISNGGFTWTDTITKIYAIADTLLKDNANDLSNWTSDGFSVTTEESTSTPSSFTESPGGNYSLLQSSSLTLNNPLNLTNSNYAYLSFKGKWDIEKSYDWVEVYASIDNGSTWTPLCGKYSSYGTDDQNLSEPVYDGVVKNWVNEEIPLTDFLGHSVKLKFEFHSDQTHNFNGIYLDDIYVLSYKNSTIGISESSSNQGITVYPNPSSGKININLSDNTKKNILVEIDDICGKKIFSNRIENPSNLISIDADKIENGSYFIKIISDNHLVKVQKIILIH